MTPEERAAKLAAEILRECDRHDATPIIAAAIREAVKAEREACREALAFAASCIKSGEPWTTECARIIDGALAKAKRPA